MTTLTLCAVLPFAGFLALLGVAVILRYALAHRRHRRLLSRLHYAAPPGPVVPKKTPRHLAS